MWFKNNWPVHYVLAKRIIRVQFFVTHSNFRLIKLLVNSTGWLFSDHIVFINQFDMSKFYLAVSAVSFEEKKVWYVNNQPVHQLDLVEKPHYYFMFSPRRSWMISSAGNWHLVHSLRVAYRAYARTVLPPPSLARQHSVSISQILILLSFFLYD